jgi:hypothetical protein
LRWVVTYVDADGDGVGTSPRQVDCLGAALPVGRSIFGDDVDDANPNRAYDDSYDDLLAILF